jgi:hypothetical protein
MVDLLHSSSEATLRHRAILACSILILVSGAALADSGHVLARTGSAAVGEDISQPSFVDNGCQIPPIVADFTIAPAVGTNV